MIPIPTVTAGVCAAHCMIWYDIHSHRISRKYIMIPIPTVTEVASPRLPQQKGEQITASPRLPQQKGEQNSTNQSLHRHDYRSNSAIGWRLNLIARYHSIANVRATVRCGYSTSILLCYHNIPYFSFGNSISTWCAAVARRSRSSCSLATNQATTKSTKKSQTLKSWCAVFCTIPWK